jgi:hypothetical protein
VAEFTQEDRAALFQAVGGIARVEGRTEQMLEHLKTLNGRVGKAETEIQLLKARNIAEQAVQQDRKKMVSLAIGATKHWKEGALFAGVVWTIGRTLLGLPVTPQ